MNLALGLALILTIGCTFNQPAVVKETRSTTEVKEYGKCKKYIKNGITIVYLTGTPYEIGLAHGKLCKREIEELNKKFFDFYDHIKKDPLEKWLKLSRQLEKNIPEE